jgi:hypothetical protein
MRKLIFGAVVSFALAGCDPLGWPSKHFDHETWLRTPETSRYVMVNDLVDRKVLNGLARDQVKALLGPASFDSLEYPGCMTYVVKEVSVLDVRFAATQPHLVEKVFSRQM